MSIFESILDKTETATPTRHFQYRTREDGPWNKVDAHDIYFYDAGRIGFWNDLKNGERILVLGTIAFDVREVSS